MTDYTPIDCRLHDHLELACMRRYRLRIRASGGRIIVGTACHTVTTPEKAEFLELEVDGQSVRLRLDEIIQIEPLDEGAEFGPIRFQPAE
ncbi:MAG: transcriptional antiterminator [Gammaproteobacteria bacterium]|nr:transcriptional antiterminator [Gammaproteobacteria bacterium]